MARLGPVCALVAALGVPLWAQAAGTVRISGRVIADGGDVLPGVTVTFAGNPSADTAVTGADGRFVIDTFVDSSRRYTLTASLPGFETVTRSRVSVSSWQTALGDITMRLGCADVDLVVTNGLAADARGADLVAHVRVESVAAEARAWRGERACVIAREVTAQIQADTAGDAHRRVRLLIGPDRAPVPGDEFVGAFAWDSGAQRYTAFVFGARVMNGIATLDDASVSAGLDREMAVDALLERLAKP